MIRLLTNINQTLNCKVDTLQILYLGLPLHIRKARKEDFRALIDKIRSRLASRKTHMITHEGRLILVQSGLSAIVIFIYYLWSHQIGLSRPSIRYGVHSCGREQTQWKEENVWLIGLFFCNPKSIGGLGILDLDILSKAFHTCWAWNLSANEKRPWCELASPEEKQVRAIFNASAKFVLGNGERTMF